MTTETILTDEQITEQFEWYVDNPDHANTFMAFARAIEQAVLQSPEIQALRKGAERYRWLRADNAYFPEENYIRGGQELDDAIDDSMLAQREKTP